jgi:hypothetical protein
LPILKAPIRSYYAVQAEIGQNKGFKPLFFGSYLPVYKQGTGPNHTMNDLWHVLALKEKLPKRDLFHAEQPFVNGGFAYFKMLRLASELNILNAQKKQRAWPLWPCPLLCRRLPFI